MPRNRRTDGFTLIELSIVLVIIGLIVGAVLVGQDLIRAAEIRAQISQIEKYQTAVNTFRLKFGYLPGDIPDPTASSFGFAARGTFKGEGDGNGLIQHHNYDPRFNGTTNGYNVATGENALFWRDLSQAGLIDGSFTAAAADTLPGSDITDKSQISGYFPQARLGNGNNIYVWSGGGSDNGENNEPGDGFNYFGISAITQIGDIEFGPGGYVYSSPGLSVQSAYNIDQKIDDGLPQSGTVTAIFSDCAVPWAGCIAWAAGGSNHYAGDTPTYGADSGAPDYGPTTAATAPASNTCYDNGNIGGAAQHYSLAQNGSAINCALSFRFQ